MTLKAVAITGGGGGGGISGSGGSPYVARWSGATSLTTGVLVDTGTRVGILQTSPVTTFQVGGNTVATASPVGAFCTLGSDSRFTADDGTRAVTLAANGTNAIIGTTTAHDLLLQRAGVTAATIKAGAIATLTGATPAATNGTYVQLALTGGTGTGATADIVVASGAVSVVVLRAPGNGYTVGDLLTCPTLTGLGAGVTVATVATVISDIEGTANITASGRLGAFTTNPRAGLDVASGGGIVSGATRLGVTVAGTNQAIETFFALQGTVNPTASNYGVWVIPQYDLTAGTINGPTIRGIECNPTVSASSAGTTQTVSIIGANVTAQRWSASDLSTGTGNLVSAVRGTATIGASTGSASTASVQCFNGLYQVSQAAHTVTNGFVYAGRLSNTGTTTTLSVYGVDTATFTNSGTIGTLYGLRLPSITNTGTITNRYGISQEDTAAINVLAAATSVGTATAPTTNTLDVSTAGWGIKLPATPGNGNARTLDCYEEGSYTATAASFIVTGASPTQPLVVVQYTRIGRLVTLTGKVTLNAGTTNWSSSIGGANITLPTGTTFDQIDGQLGAGLLWSTAGTPAVYSGVIMHPTNRLIYFPTVTPATTLTHYFTLQYMTAT